MNEQEIARLKAATAIVRVIGETLPLQRDGRQYVARCPFHGERTPSFTVYSDHFYCFGCGVHGDVFAWLMQAHRMTFPEAVAHLGGEKLRLLATVAPPPPTAEEPDVASRVEFARRIWCEAIDPHDTPVQTYLRHRDAELPDAQVLRFHPHCPRKEGALPAMVAKMTDPISGEPTGVHRTFILPDGSGKAPVAKPKVMLGVAGVIRLVDDEWIGAGLGLTEGIETALSVMQRVQWGPVWAAGSSGGISSFPVLRATTLNIFCDHDKGGLRAAEACAARWNEAGEEVYVHIPPIGEDWNDTGRRLPE